MLVDANKVKKFITEPNLEIDLRPLLLFRGGLTEGQAKARFNFLRSAMEAGLRTVTEITAASVVDNDIAHLCGLHAKAGWQRTGVMGFFSRVLQSPSVLEKAHGLDDYIHSVVEQTRHAILCRYDPIAKTSVWSTRAWRRPARKRLAPMAEVYPFITSTPTEDHDMLLAVDRLVPRNLDPEMRADVCQDMIVALLMGEINLDNLRDKTPQFVKRLYKEMPSKYGHLSLDAPLVYGDGNRRTLAETLV